MIPLRETRIRLNKIFVAAPRAMEGSNRDERFSDSSRVSKIWLTPNTPYPKATHIMIPTADARYSLASRAEETSPPAKYKNTRAAALRHTLVASHARNTRRALPESR